MFLVHFKYFLHFIKSVLFRIFSNTSLQDKRECQKLRDRWGADPIHLTPAGYSALAESLLDSYSIEKEEKKDSADPVKDTEQKGRPKQKQLDRQPMGFRHRPWQPEPVPRTLGKTSQGKRQARQAPQALRAVSSGQ